MLSQEGLKDKGKGRADGDEDGNGSGDEDGEDDDDEEDAWDGWEVDSDQEEDEDNEDGMEEWVDVPHSDDEAGPARGDSAAGSAGPASVAPTPEKREHLIEAERVRHATSPPAPFRGKVARPHSLPMRLR